MKKKLVILLTLISISMYAQNNESGVLLELFTSQGCSSCPPADELIDQVKEAYKDKNVYVLSYHVDYWNRLGWKDPFSAEAYSDYQREYAQQFSSRSIYTPQIVVNGSEHFVGSSRVKTNEALRRYGRSKSTNTIMLTNPYQEKDAITINYQVDGDTFDRLTFALVIAERITKIGRGENRNRTLKNTNIVANRVLTKEHTGQVTISIPDWVEKEDQLSVIAYTQDNNLSITAISNTVL